LSAFAMKQPCSARKLRSVPQAAVSSHRVRSRSSRPYERLHNLTCGLDKQLCEGTEDSILQGCDGNRPARIV
jgi:hypothetical protein